MQIHIRDPPHTHDVPPCSTLAEQCWHAQPGSRPTAEALLAQLHKLASSSGSLNYLSERPMARSNTMPLVSAGGGGQAGAGQGSRHVAAIIIIIIDSP